MLDNKKILLIVSGGIAAYKCPDLVRRLRQRAARVRCVLTNGGAEFVTPLALGAVSEDKVYQDLFSLTDEDEMGHIRLSREADLVLVAPATANILAKMAHGIADDLASTALMASDKPILCAPAMNVRMWENPATLENLATLAKRGVGFIGPEEGDMACGEWGLGRMSEPDQIADAVEEFFRQELPLNGIRSLVTSGPTLEAIDPVRYLANRSSGKQGHAIAAALSRLGAATTLVSGPSHQPDPVGVKMVKVETAVQMLDACESTLPVDVAILAAAVSDWRVETAEISKIKKGSDKKPPALTLVENPDILATLSAVGNARPRLVIGFAAETDDVIANATQKRAKKGCDWIVANDVKPETGTFGGDANTVHLITEDGVEDWPTQSKAAVAERLAERVVETLTATQ
ncbi:MAG TPA: bifunctional phosphopantothenoylcysteine decarboxylase/phosphopantothenate--cysteine ligase CoaBC [Rhodospirillales bacterium]|jgi:phosphopantothenoylcysteine decarboxylase/phosphopantothenate--cysteine ligase|nr:bifunctional phosphopantothenoylcysteine decarboxylase/phosphopantothenate--cysteine ligase CoaBC [Rhodospirillales bacterium]HIM76829.1 bifunctional phosphopantothenoylcysteine decarboxylase/phosphopantothenate--cysteine ligase CoaBC [Rhodospirillales bacterium]